MPTYDYTCEDCGYTEERFYPRPADAPAEDPYSCPCGSRFDADTIVNCGGVMRRQIGAGAGAIFKGPGFYATDYRKAEPPKEDK